MKITNIMKLIALVMSLVFLGLTAQADICFKTFEQDTAEADIIFVGHLIEKDIDAFWHRGDPLEIFTFEIQESFKGLHKYLEIISILGSAYGCCNVHFELDSTYLVFAYADGKNSMTYWTNDCSLSGLLTDTKEYYDKLGESLIPSGNEHAKNYFLAKKAIKDSINQAHVNLLNDLVTEQKRTSKLTFLL